jgi:hypothetical protein
VLAADEHPVVVEGNWDRDKVVMLSFASEADFASLPIPGVSEISGPASRNERFVVLVRGVTERK